MKSYKKKDFFYNHIPEFATPEMIKKIFDRAYLRALRYLSFRNRSEKEIRDFLKTKEFDNSIIDNVVELLLQQKFLNDKQFAESWVESRQKSKAKSKIIIKAELRQKGIANDIIEETLSESADDYETAKQFFEKKKSRFDKYTGEEYFQKAAAFLQRRGFSWDIVKRVLKDSDEDEQY